MSNGELSDTSERATLSAADLHELAIEKGYLGHVAYQDQREGRKGQTIQVMQRTVPSFAELLMLDAEHSKAKFLGRVSVTPQ